MSLFVEMLKIVIEMQGLMLSIIKIDISAIKIKEIVLTYYSSMYIIIVLM